MKKVFPAWLWFVACLAGCIGVYFACGGSPEAGVVSNVAWYAQLPACPCENPDKNGVVLNDGWAKDVGNIKKYHAGATESFRSYPALKTPAGLSGQQCCYDANGRLITGGSAAGTPDQVSTCTGEDAQGVMCIDYGSVWGHYMKDIRPWSRYGGENGGWVQYNRFWPPNNGCGCDEHVVSVR